MRIFKHTNGNYYARYFTKHGYREVSLRTKNAEEAQQRVRDSRIANIEQLSRADALTQDTITRSVVGHKLTCGDAVAIWHDWTSVAGLSPATVRSYQLQINLFLRSTGLIDKPTSCITDSMIAEWVNAPGLSASARSNRLRAVRSLVEVLHSKNLLSGNPVEGMRVRKDDLSFEQKEIKERLPFTEAEIETMMLGLPPEWQIPATVALDAGLRMGDVACLEWASVRADGTLIVHTDKFDKRIAFPMTRRLRIALLSVDKTHPRWVFPALQAMAENPKDRPKLSTYFGRALAKVGIRGKTFHNLRHTFATRRRDAGDTVDQIREKLGHSLETTTAGYIHAP